MSSKLFYRIASILLLLFALGHTLGFRKTDPEWGVDAVVMSMQAVHFNTQGFGRTYYDFYVGFGLFVSVFLLFAAVLAWQLGRLGRETLRQLPFATWGLVLCFVGVTVLSWEYFFVIPLILSSVITICLVAAAWLAVQ